MRQGLIIITLALLASPASATSASTVSSGSSGGKLSTLARGAYACEMPGDAATGRGIEIPEEDFTIVNASTYHSGEQSGTYLRTGDLVTMTSGPKKGSRYSIKSERFLRKLAQDGTASGLRCIKLGAEQG